MILTVQGLRSETLALRSMCRAPGESAKSRSFCCFPYFCWRKIWVCLYFQIWLLDVFGQAIFTVFNQVSPVTSSVGPARHTLHTLHTVWLENWTESKTRKNKHESFEKLRKSPHDFSTFQAGERSELESHRSLHRWKEPPFLWVFPVYSMNFVQFFCCIFILPCHLHVYHSEMFTAVAGLPHRLHQWSDDSTASHRMWWVSTCCACGNFAGVSENFF